MLDEPEIREVAAALRAAGGRPRRQSADDPAPPFYRRRRQHALIGGGPPDAEGSTDVHRPGRGSVPGVVPQDVARGGPRFELTGVLRKFQDANQFPMVLFENVKGCDVPVLGNALGSRDRLALLFDTDSKGLAQAYEARQGTRIPPEIVDTGPVKEVVQTGDDIDVTRIANIVHCADDAGEYISSGVTRRRRTPTSASTTPASTASRSIGPRELRLDPGVYSHIWHMHHKQRAARRAARGGDRDRPLPEHLHGLAVPRAARARRDRGRGRARRRGGAHVPGRDARHDGPGRRRDRHRGQDAARTSASRRARSASSAGTSAPATTRTSSR